MRRSTDTMETKPSRLLSRSWLVGLAVGASTALAGPAGAVAWNFGPESRLTWTTTLEYSATYRVDERDSDLASRGNENFDTGFVDNQVSILTEVGYSYKNLGAFIRADAFYNRAYEDETDSPVHEEFSDNAQDTHLSDVRLLDAFVYGNFNLNGHWTSVRIGRQVISWGENLFLGGIGASQNPVDATESHEPAVEVKSLFLPQGTVFGQIQLTPNLSAAAYWRWDWERTRLAAAGGYFSAADIINPGDRYPGPQWNGRDEPSGSQYGVNLHYTVPTLNYTDFGFYYLNYHSKAATPVFTGPTTYYSKYYEGIDLYGVSMNTTVFQYMQIGAEASYREGRPVSGAAGTVRANTVQVLLNTVTNIPADLLGSGSSTLSAGIGWHRITDLEEDEIKASKELGAAKYTVSLALSYPNIAPLLDMTITPQISKAFHNDSAVRAPYNSGNTSMGLGVSFAYSARWNFGVNYVRFMGDATENIYTDRDYVGASVSYTF